MTISSKSLRGAAFGALLAASAAAVPAVASAQALFSAPERTQEGQVSFAGAERGKPVVPGSDVVATGRGFRPGQSVVLMYGQTALSTGAIDQVLADRIQFQQAVVNLVRNGVEAASGREDALVQIKGRAVADGYRISIEDNGPGLRGEHEQRLFEPMISTKPGGMGLGLSVTRSIIERHGGALSVGRSDSLGGAAFFFTLPRIPETSSV